MNWGELLFPVVAEEFINTTGCHEGRIGDGPKPEDQFCMEVATSQLS